LRLAFLQPVAVLHWCRVGTPGRLALTASVRHHYQLRIRRFVKKGTMGTLARQAEIGVWVKAPGALRRSWGYIIPGKCWDCACKVMQSSAFWRS